MAEHPDPTPRHKHHHHKRDRDDDGGRSHGDRDKRHRSADKHGSSGKHHASDRDRDRDRDHHRDQKKESRHSRHGKSSKHDKGDKRDKRDRRDRRVGNDSRGARSASGDDESSEVPPPTLPLPGTGAVALTKSDYFARANELRVWLLEEKGIYLDELPSDKARALFKVFARAWNAGGLPPKYYAGLPETQLAASARTRHKWAFASKLSEADKLRLESTKDNVDTNTHRDHANVR